MSIKFRLPCMVIDHFHLTNATLEEPYDLVLSKDTLFSFEGCIPTVVQSGCRYRPNISSLFLNILMTENCF